MFVSRDNFTVNTREYNNKNLQFSKLCYWIMLEENETLLLRVFSSIQLIPYKKPAYHYIAGWSDKYGAFLRQNIERSLH